MKTYVIDIDGTLADLTHRLHLIYRARPGGPDWDAFYQACAADSSTPDVIRVVCLLCLHPTVAQPLYLTGRMERVRPETQRWLDDNRLPAGDLLMRADRDHRPDTVVKPEMLAAWRAGQTPAPEIVGVFEDRPSVCRVWREMGLTVFQVGSGEEF